MTPSIRFAACAGMAAISITASAGVSFARSDTRTMSCDQTRALILRTGAIVLTTGQHTYDRFVAHNGYCYHPKVPTITYIKTKDANECPVHICETPMFYDD